MHAAYFSFSQWQKKNNPCFIQEYLCDRIYLYLLLLLFFFYFLLWCGRLSRWKMLKFIWKRMKSHTYITYTRTHRIVYIKWNNPPTIRSLIHTLKPLALHVSHVANSHKSKQNINTYMYVCIHFVYTEVEILNLSAFGGRSPTAVEHIYCFSCILYLCAHNHKFGRTDAKFSFIIHKYFWEKEKCAIVF